MKFRNFDKYEVYEDGRIWSYKYKKFLKPQTLPNGYQQVCLTDNEGKTKMYYVHRVVWEAVTRSQIQPGMEINHISEVKNENSFSNLELVTPKQNINYGTGNARRAESQSKQVYQYSKDGELIAVWESTKEAQRNGFNSGSVAKCCNGKIKSHKGYIWSYEPIK